MKGHTMFEGLELVEMSDAELDDVAASGKGKPAIYRKPISELLTVAGDKGGNIPAPWRTIHPGSEATRATVIVGMRAAIKKHDAAKNRGMTVKANPSDELVTVYVRAIKTEADSV